LGTREGLRIEEVTLDAYNAFCAKLPHAHTVIQWSGSHVWKVSTKLFAIASLSNAPIPFITFKCSPMSFDLLRAQPGLIPAPYLASRGMKWIQRVNADSMDDAALQDYLRESHRLASLNLPKHEQKRLGLNQR
jgi:predicted DNA-binding protein (MmcQ/YjbR family)